jgi:hypothetical protein
MLIINPDPTCSSQLLRMIAESYYKGADIGAKYYQETFTYKMNRPNRETDTLLRYGITYS